MKTAIAYVRVSTEDQKLGPEAQRAAIEEWAARESVTIVGWHHDLGVSGGADIEDRPGLMAAIEDVRAKKATILAVAKRDRLARDVYIATGIERLLAKGRCRIISADGAGNGDSAADEFMRNVLASAAAYERALIRARTKAALAAKRARGERNCRHAPYGFRHEDGKLVPDPAEQQVIAEIRAHRAAGESYGWITRKYTTREGTPMSRQQVKNICG